MIVAMQMMQTGRPKTRYTPPHRATTKASRNTRVQVINAQVMQRVFVGNLRVIKNSEILGYSKLKLQEGQAISYDYLEDYHTQIAFQKDEFNKDILILSTPGTRTTQPIYGCFHNLPCLKEPLRHIYGDPEIIIDVQNDPFEIELTKMPPIELILVYGQQSKRPLIHNVVLFDFERHTFKFDNYLVFIKLVQNDSHLKILLSVSDGPSTIETTSIVHYWNGKYNYGECEPIKLSNEIQEPILLYFEPNRT